MKSSAVLRQAAELIGDSATFQVEFLGTHTCKVPWHYSACWAIAAALYGTTKLTHLEDGKRITLWEIERRPDYQAAFKYLEDFKPKPTPGFGPDGLPAYWWGEGRGNKARTIALLMAAHEAEAQGD